MKVVKSRPNNISKRKKQQPVNTGRKNKKQKKGLGGAKEAYLLALNSAFKQFIKFYVEDMVEVNNSIARLTEAIKILNQNVAQHNRNKDIHYRIIDANSSG